MAGLIRESALLTNKVSRVGIESGAKVLLDARTAGTGNSPEPGATKLRCGHVGGKTHFSAFPRYIKGQCLQVKEMVPHGKGVNINFTIP